MHIHVFMACPLRVSEKELTRNERHTPDKNTHLSFPLSFHFFPGEEKGRSGTNGEKIPHLSLLVLPLNLARELERAVSLPVMLWVVAKLCLRLTAKEFEQVNMKCP